MRTLISVLTLSVFLAAGTALACDYAEDSTETAALDSGEVVLASIVLTVSDASCGGCVVPIRNELTALNGVSKVEGSETDFHDITVTFTSGAVSTEQMIAAVKKAGFTATVKEAAEQS
jgi:copper chaperone CopZ